MGKEEKKEGKGGGTLRGGKKEGKLGGLSWVGRG